METVREVRRAAWEDPSECAEQVRGGWGRGRKRRRPLRPPVMGARSNREVERDGGAAAVKGGDLPAGPDF